MWLWCRTSRVDCLVAHEDGWLHFCFMLPLFSCDVFSSPSYLWWHVIFLLHIFQLVIVHVEVWYCSRTFLKLCPQSLRLIETVTTFAAFTLREILSFSCQSNVLHMRSILLLWKRFGFKVFSSIPTGQPSMCELIKKLIMSSISHAVGQPQVQTQWASNVLW